MRLQEGIERHDKFQNSINLSLDINHMEKVDTYIPTRSSLEVLDYYLDCIIGKKKVYSTILIGPYGKGKSHLLLVLLTLLRGIEECQEAAELLCGRVRIGKSELAEKMETILVEKKRFLPVLVTHVQEDLNRGFLLALHEALVREGLENLVPHTYFSEAVTVIESWQEHYPDTYQKLEELLAQEGEEGKKLIRQLSQYDKKSYERFVRLYPKLTSGGVFQPMINMSAFVIYQSVNDVLCSQYGYTGMYLIFDEFSKYIENHQPETISGDMKILQEMCELANNSKERQLYLTFVAHKSIKEYGTSLPAAVLNSFTGVEGRMTEVFFLTSIKNNYELISYAIKKKKGLYQEYWKDSKKCTEFIEEFYQTAGFSAAFSKDEFQKIIVEGCFPLTPLAAYFLLSISEKVAQNERTLFTFLSKEEPYSLVWIIQNRKEEEDWLIGLPEIYDYFSSLFRKETAYIAVHQEWLKADFALNQTEDITERRIIKTLALIRMLHMPEEVSGNDKMIRLGAYLPQEVYQEAKERLLQKQLLCFRVKTAAYDFKQNIGVDLEEEIQKIEQLYFSNLSIIEALQKYSGMDYEIPKQYNQNFAMTRFFQYQFMQEKDFLELEKTEYLFQDNFADGKVLLLLLEEERESHTEAIKQKLEELKDSRIAVIQPLVGWEKTELFRRIAAIEYLLQKEEFLEQNQVMQQELFLSQEDVFYELNQLLQKKYHFELGNSMLYVYKRKEKDSVYKEPICYQGITQIQYNRILSQILEEYYNQTPIINQELINRNHISAPIRRARNHIVEKLLKQEDLHIFETGTSPEATIFRATLWHTGLLGGEQKQTTAFLQVLDQIERFIKRAEQKKCSFLELYRVLQGEAVGMRRGTIPIYLAYCLVQFQGMVVIYRKQMEVPFCMETLDQINETPSEYELCTEEGTTEKTEYQRNLMELFQKYETKGGRDRDLNRRITEAISRWIRSLPQYTLLSNQPAEGVTEQEFQKICEFRKLFQRQEINPWEALFLKLPQICQAEENSFLIVFEKIAFWKQILDRHIEQVKKRAADRIKEIFYCRETEDLAQGLKFWYEKQREKAEQNLYSRIANSFLNDIREITTHNEQELVSRISKVVLDLFVEDWKDGSLEELLEKLEQIKREVEDKLEERKREEGRRGRILLEDSYGTVIEKYYTQQTEELNTYFFRNSLMDLMEEVGESVELEQKVAVLADVLKNLIDTKTDCFRGVRRDE